MDAAIVETVIDTLTREIERRVTAESRAHAHEQRVKDLEGEKFRAAMHAEMPKPPKPRSAEALAVDRLLMEVTQAIVEIGAEAEKRRNSAGVRAGLRARAERMRERVEEIRAARKVTP